MAPIPTHTHGTPLNREDATTLTIPRYPFGTGTGALLLGLVLGPMVLIVVFAAVLWVRCLVGQCRKVRR
ncbi:hypothetical protein EX30DRAFT_344377 [Ascodesmis nigricans]|uniref:Uncharacterized protein n=1 Tax=Ascodesmis nigricans TaxID=341454 RepID=A0A4S2MJE0_9PEZI|nr:hypothetical protein EX30DRAFT_344377 [Ascodesmis nigricans]